MPNSRLFNAWFVYGMVTLGVVLCSAVVWLVVGVSDRKPAGALLACVLITISRLAAWSTVREMVRRTPGTAPFAHAPRAGFAASIIDLTATALALALAWLVGELMPRHVLAQLAAVVAGVIVLFGAPSPVLLRRPAGT